jgi:hypothetical protein
MTDINKLKEDKRKALEELDEAMNACSPEQIERIQNEEKVKKNFLFIVERFTKTIKLKKKVFCKSAMNLQKYSMKKKR